MNEWLSEFEYGKVTMTQPAPGSFPNPVHTAAAGHDFTNTGN